MHVSKPLYSTTKILRKFNNFTYGDQTILFSRFCLILLNYLMIFYRFQSFEAKYSIILTYTPIAIICYGAICIWGSYIKNFRITNLILTFIDIFLVSCGFYYFADNFFRGASLIYFVGIILDVFYGGYFSSLGLSILATIGFTLATLPEMHLKTTSGFYYWIISFNLLSFFILIFGFKVKNTIHIVEKEKEASKKQFYRLQTISRIAKEIAGELEKDKLIFLILQKAVELTKSQVGGLILKDEDDLYRIKAVKGLSKGYLNRELNISNKLFSKVLLEKKTIINNKSTRSLSTPASNNEVVSNTEIENYKYSIVTPIWSKDEIIGLLFLLSNNNYQPFTRDDQFILETLSEHASIAVVNAKMFNMITTLSLNDYLTGLGNQRFFYQQLEHCLAIASRYQQSCSLMIVDSDSLKLINDQHGNSGGFKHIKHLAEILKSTVRSSDWIARYDRDMFMLILPQTDLSESINLGRRIQTKISQIPLAIEKEEIYTTASIGISAYPEEALNVNSLITMAERALYFAKQQGKNQLATASNKIIN